MPSCLPRNATHFIAEFYIMYKLKWDYLSVMWHYLDWANYVLFIIGPFLVSSVSVWEA